MIESICTGTRYKVHLFGDKIPMSQGMAVGKIMLGIGGKLLIAGDIIGHSHDGGLIYIKSERGGGTAESIWLDNGVSVKCLYLNLGDGWKVKLDEGWVKSDLQVEVSNDH